MVLKESPEVAFALVKLLIAEEISRLRLQLLQGKQVSCIPELSLGGGVTLSHL